MHPEARNNPYALLALFISPWKKINDIDALKQLIKEGVVPWKELLFQANNNLCTPLWYVSLKNCGLLDLLADEL